MASNLGLTPTDRCLDSSINMQKDEWIHRLSKLLGRSRVLTDSEERQVYSFDASRRRALPDVVVFPQGSDDVRRVMRIASRNRIPVYPRGAGTGMVGGALAKRGGIALVMTSMNRIIEINPVNYTVRIQPGVIVEDLKKAAKSKGLFYPPDPASAKFASIGGTVAVNSGGLNSLKYGVTRDYVLALEVVSARGEALKFGAGTLKSATGYDLMRLLIGSEGTLAVITEITVRLIPHPKRYDTLLALFPDDMAALKAAIGIVSEPLLPCALEFMDETAVYCARKFTGDERLQKACGALLIEFDSLSNDSCASLMGRTREICREAGALDIHDAADADEREALWEVRRSLSPAVYEIAPTKVNEDICVPRSEMAAVIREIKRIARSRGLRVVNFAHAGDGNIHVNFMFDGEDKKKSAAAKDAVKELFAIVVKRGGTLSGEHGVGIAKLPYLGMQLGAKEIGLMRRIKKVFDPDGILNPGKIFHGGKGLGNFESFGKRD